MKTRVVVATLVAVVLLSGNVFGALIDLGPGSFTPAASKITFSEYALGTVNPTYNFVGLPGLGNVDVTFDGYFMGQANTGAFPDTLSDTTPTGPLTLDPASPDTFISNDGAAPDSPVLSGTPTFNGVISVLFSTPVAGVGLTGGYFNGIGSTTIEAYDAAGNSLGSIVNTILGMEFYGLADSSGANIISGISFYITGDEPAGFAIDNLTFGSSQVINGTVPVPGAVMLGLLGSGMVGYLRRRKTL